MARHRTLEDSLYYALRLAILEETNSVLNRLKETLQVNCSEHEENNSAIEEIDLLRLIFYDISMPCLEGNSNTATIANY